MTVDSPLLSIVIVKEIIVYITAIVKAVALSKFILSKTIMMIQAIWGIMLGIVFISS
jgi:hypothetical protein